jgi:hypothetical protein
LPEFLAGAAFLLRSAGVALLGAWIADNLLRRQWRRALASVIVSAVCVGGWQVYVWHVKRDPLYVQPAYPYQRAAYQFYNVGYVENLLYVDPFKPELGRISARDFAARVGGNFRVLPARLGATVCYISDHFYDWLQSRLHIRLSPRVVYWLPSLFGVLSFVGLALLVARRQWLLPLYVGGSVIVMSVTPWPAQYLRYLWPLAPLVSIAAAIAIAAGREALARGVRRVNPMFIQTPAIAIASIMLGLEAFSCVAQFRKDHLPVKYRDPDGQEIRYSLFGYDRFWTAHDAALDWLAAHSDSGDVVVTSSPQWLFIRIGRKAVMPPFEDDPALTQKLIDSVPAKYVVVDDIFTWGRRYLQPMVERFPERWKRVYGGDTGSTTVYERISAQ